MFYSSSLKQKKKIQKEDIKISLLLISTGDNSVTLSSSKPGSHTAHISCVFQLAPKSTFFIHLHVNVLNQKQMLLVIMKTFPSLIRMYIKIFKILLLFVRKRINNGPLKHIRFLIIIMAKQFSVQDAPYIYSYQDLIEVL